MADSYIDYTETQTYGEHFVDAAKARTYAKPFFSELAKQVKRATKRVKDAVDVATAGTTGIREGSKDRAGLLPNANALLTSTNQYLRSHQDAAEPSAFFPHGRHQVGDGASDIQKALERCAKAFKDSKHKKLPEAKKRSVELATAAKDLAKAIKKGTVGRGATAAADAPGAREQFLRVYGAAKLIAEGAIRLYEPELNVATELKLLFKDLTVATRTSGADDGDAPTNETGTRSAAPPGPIAGH